MRTSHAGKLMLGGRGMVVRALISALPILNLAGCGQQTAESAQSSCEFVRSPIAMSARGRLGATPEEVLVFSAKEFAVPLNWSDQRAATISPDAPREFEVGVEYDGGSVMEVTSEEPGCDPSLEIDVSVNLSSRDGAFAERRTSTLSAPSRTNANVALTIPVEELDGQLRLAPSAQGWSITAIVVLVSITPEGSSGEILALSMRNEDGEDPTQVDPDLAAGEFRIASWE